jgi:hypothetical protein
MIIVIALIIGVVGGVGGVGGVVANQPPAVPAPDYTNPNRPACVWFALEDQEERK